MSKTKEVVVTAGELLGSSAQGLPAAYSLWTNGTLSNFQKVDGLNTTASMALTMASTAFQKYASVAARLGYAGVGSNILAMNLSLAQMHDAEVAGDGRGYNAALMGYLSALFGAISGAMPLTMVGPKGATLALSLAFAAAKEIISNPDGVSDGARQLWEDLKDALTPPAYQDPNNAGVQYDPTNPWNIRIPQPVSPDIGNTPDPLVKKIRYVDPLILDLAGDGFHMKGLQQGAPVLFDANGDGIKTSTAWASPSDGILALDRDGDGLIENGGELFGDETVLQNGKKAAHGFEALADLDSNNDGIFDVKDARYGDVRVWRDLNQDGVSQSNELVTLPQAGVEGINLSSSASGAAYTDSRLVQQGGFTRTDGSVGEAGSFVLAQNNFVREFVPVELSAEAMGLPVVEGTGWVRDLPQAATLHPELVALVNAAKAATSIAEYNQRMEDLIRAWGNTSDYRSASKVAVSQGYGLILSEPQDAQEASWMNVAVKGSDAERAAFRAGLSTTELQKFDDMRERMVGDLERMYAYEAFTGYTFLDYGKIYNDAYHYEPPREGGGGVRPVEVLVPLTEILAENRIGHPSSQAGFVVVSIPAPVDGSPHVSTLWQRLMTNVQDNLAPTLWLAKYTDQVEIELYSDGSTQLNFDRLNQALADQLASDTYAGASTILALKKYVGRGLDAQGWSSDAQVAPLIAAAHGNADLRRALTDAGFELLAGGAMTGDEKNNAICLNGPAQFSAGAGNDFVIGSDGADTLSGDVGDDTLIGGGGHDSLSGGDGSDTLDGGIGNDAIQGGRGDDVILFGKGDGQDYVYSDYDTRANRMDVLRFKDGVSPDEIVASRDGSGLVLSIAGTTDKVTVSYFFEGDNPRNAYNPLQQVRFADGSAWSAADIVARYLAGTAGNDQLLGTLDDDVINGQSGSDTIGGYGGNDVINGGAGDDNLSGNAGNDVIDGGAGNDYLSGGDGDDVILFGKGDGQDYLTYDRDTRADRKDVLQFKEGVSADEIGLKRDGNALVLSIADTTDKVTVSYFFEGDNPRNAYNPLQQVRFADGSAWSAADIVARYLAGTAGNDQLLGTLDDDVINGQSGSDTIGGYGGNDVINGGAGDDNLSGNAGNDVIDGGAGNDYLSGGDGDDVILFGKGDGQDYLTYDRDTRADRKDVLQFKEGVSADEIGLKRDGNALVLSIADTTDKVTVAYFFEGDNPRNAYNPLQQVRFADGSAWSAADIVARYLAGTAGNDQLLGTLDDDVINGQSGSDTIGGYGGNDVINGGAGDDNLSGNAGNDVIDGGAGNDYLSGGDGDDVILFGKGDGQDYLTYDRDTRADRKDVLQFKAGVIADEIIATRDGNALVLSITGTSDRITISYFFENNDPRNAYNPVQEVRFADGTAWTTTQILAAMSAGTSGADTITGTNGDDVIDGRGGNDTLNGGTGNDQLFGGTGSDNVRGEAGNDTLDGGAGNDSLGGGDGDDVILFGKGDGQDYLTYDYDTRANRMDVLQFKEGVSANEIVVTRDGNAAVLSIAGTSDKITVAYFFEGDNPRNAYNPLQQVRFADGSSWTIDDIVARYLAGTAGNDQIQGTVNADVINGQAGSDTLYGYAGNDRLNGGDGNDGLYGGAGSDTLDGGAGNDSLGGGDGDDVILFGKGDGQDYLTYDYDTRANRMDVLQFKEGVSTNEIVVTRDGNAAVLSIAGTSDKITVAYFFEGDNPRNAYNPLQQVRFADGSSWTIDDIVARYLAGTAGNDQIQGTVNADVINGQTGSDTLYGYAGNDRLNGGDGNDGLYGGAGSDTLDGGAGNDSLGGGDGDDVILFGKGDGQDYLTYDYDTRANRMDVLQFKEGVSTNEIVVTRDGNAAVLSIAGTTDKITVGYFFDGDNPRNAYNPLQQVRFADGSSWTIDDIVARYLGGTAGNDQIQGTVNADVINGQTGSDALYGYAGNDRLNGGDGNDNLYGGAGSDMLDGGAGNDSLGGGDGDDVILFGRGDGQDYLTYDYDSRANRMDVVQFKEGVSANEVVVTRDGNAAVLSIAGTTDKITVGYFFDGDNPRNAYNPLQQVRFADGSSWTIDDIVARYLGGTAGNDQIQGTVNADVINGQGGNDIISGYDGNDVIHGGAGDDNLAGSGGNDVIDGDAGNDLVTGGAGDDVILFGKGDGQDYLTYDYDSRADRNDVLRFKAGVSPDEVVASRDSSSLVLNVAGSTDKVTVAYFYDANNPSNPYNPVRRVEFADGTVWSLTDIDNKVKGLPVTGASSAQSAGTARQADALVAAMASFSAASGTASDSALPSYNDDNPQLLAAATR